MLKRFIRDESGATAIEYGLIAALVSLAIVGGITQVMDGVQNTFNYVSDIMTNAVADAE
ncbi:Flp family type IVb pilin [Mesorhizobium microcysteis]|jgi:pilus assembly protein Flp/PilA|uniref:Flp family type IVb pilin n=1 Tax=Neoaquamicrobium microcysteis TaxID=2682781 RepID=A0A5D4GRI1_9HYPH|nr:Flp family type IVb pilin [Mesorhizobium microcysteis]TYR30329.1 Flp family type IVb pilin [Mesorhizobium microcysteis]